MQPQPDLADLGHSLLKLLNNVQADSMPSRAASSQQGMHLDTAVQGNGATSSPAHANGVHKAKRGPPPGFGDYRALPWPDQTAAASNVQTQASVPCLYGMVQIMA